MHYTKGQVIMQLQEVSFFIEACKLILSDNDHTSEENKPFEKSLVHLK